jgi:hypothetical protein
MKINRCFSSWKWALALVALGGCGSSDPFDYVQVQGKVTYDDGSTIPAQFIRVTFVPQTPPADVKTHPRPGVAEVDVATGSFNVVSSHNFGDGIVRGAHKVTIVALDQQLNATPAVPAVYADVNTTPLAVDASASPYHFQVRKPGS